MTCKLPTIPSGLSLTLLCLINRTFHILTLIQHYLFLTLSVPSLKSFFYDACKQVPVSVFQILAFACTPLNPT